MVCKDTLRIKYLPKELSDAQKEDFIKHFGAHTIKVITSKAKARSVVYAKFDNEDVAKNVMGKLHQIEILNSTICVEYAEADLLKGLVPTEKNGSKKETQKTNFLKTFINNVNAFNDSVNFYQPPPSHLKYNYPKANEATLNNIAHALATIPRFYTQVIHLMNKMNLPPPFADSSANTVQYYTQIAQPAAGKKRQVSTSESEMESDNSDKIKEIIPQKRVVSPKKMSKRPRLIKPPQVKTGGSNKPMEKTENVFEKVDMVPQRKIELNIQPTEKQGTVDVKNTPDSKVETQKTTVPEIVKQNPVTTPKKVNIVPASTNSTNIFCSDNIKVTVAQPLAIPKVVAVEEKNIQKQTVHPGVKQRPLKSEPIKVQTIETESTCATNQEITPLLRVEHNKDLAVLQQGKDIASKLSDNREFESQPQIKVAAPVTQEEVPQDYSVVQIHQMGTLSQDTETCADQTSLEDPPCITLEELAANQITDLSSLTVFKNYSPGEPTNKLYIKNCAKTVVVQDLEYIYNRYRDEHIAKNPSEFNIRLMQEGRMKGQAFVTLDSIEQAEKAVKETNGFILKDRPLIVVFGKTGKKKEGTQK